MDVAGAVRPSRPPPSPPSFFADRLRPNAGSRARPSLSSSCAVVLSAGLAAAVVARRVWGEGSAPLVFLEALTGAAQKACLCVIFLFFAHMAFLLCLHGFDGLLILGAIVFDLVLDFRKSEIGQIVREAMQEAFSFPGAVFGGVVYVFSVLLIFAGYLVAMMSSPAVDGSISMGENVGSLIMDVGTFGMHAMTIFFFVVPAFAPRARREDPSRIGVTVC